MVTFTVDQNIFEIPENEISKIKVLQTYFKGNKVYDMNLPDKYEDPDERIEELITEALKQHVDMDTIKETDALARKTQNELKAKRYTQ